MFAFLNQYVDMTLIFSSAPVQQNETNTHASLQIQDNISSPLEEILSDILNLVP